MKRTTLCYIEQDEKYLMLYRNKKENDCNEGKWIGVGGKLEVGETPDQCLLREVKEETGLVLTNYTLRGVIDFVSDEWPAERMYLYSADEFVGEADMNCSEGTLKWIPKRELMSLAMWEGDRVFLERMARDESNILLTLRYEGEKLVAVEEELVLDEEKC